MLAAWHQDPELMRAAYAHSSAVLLTIDGLQPEKGHETLYVVRELEQRRVWFAEPLLSSCAEEIRRLLVRAREMAAALNLSVSCWMSDQQEAFNRKCGRVSRRAAPLLSEPFSAGRGETGAGAGQPRQGPDAEESPWFAGNRARGVAATVAGPGAAVRRRSAG